MSSRVRAVRAFSGTAGSVGPTGADGATGPSGIDGTDGATGPTGADGATGPAGVDGTDGTAGATGPAGANGTDGAAGTSSWTDGINTVSTTGSVQLGSDTADGTDDCNAENAGTIRFNTATQTFESCDGTSWNTLALSPTPIYEIGDTGPAGGIVFYVTNDGHDGLEVSPVDLGIGVDWGCSGTAIAGADESAVGTGAQNTKDILAGCGEAGIAARLADEYSLGGYSDWFLPSKDELRLLSDNVADIFIDDPGIFYWSSTEFDQTLAFSVSLSLSGGGNVCGCGKTS
ncbi:MAG: hypothetical protein GY779_18180, partial [Gammaproteobacteria bacterium]|nr:hypothetical protein [Gammaproteobacteria bacterium]